MKTFPIPSAPPRDDRDRPKANDNDSDDSSPAYAKGGKIGQASYAKGGVVLGRTREFLKEGDDRGTPVKSIWGASEKKEYNKSGKGAKGADKCLPTVMPRQ